AGGGGIDTLSYALFGNTQGTTDEGIVVNLSGDDIEVNGVEVLSGTAVDQFGDTDTVSGFEIVVGSGSDDTIYGSDAGMTIVGGSGFDSIVGGDGNDVLRGDSGNDVLIGGDGIDTVDYFHESVSNSPDWPVSGPDAQRGGVTVNLSDVAIGAGLDAVAAHTAIDSFGGVDTLSGIENVEGTEFNDTFVGSAGDNVFVSHGGNDTVVGGDGTDTVVVAPGLAYEDFASGAGKFIVSTETGELTLSGTEIVTSGDDRYFLVGNGGFNSYAAAVAAASANGGNTVGQDHFVVGDNEAPVVSDDIFAPAGQGWLQNPDNGHLYRFVSAPNISWTAAAAAAEAAGGYLVTVTSEAENAFLEANFHGNYWMGGSDAGDEGIWQWVTGPEAGTQFWYLMGFGYGDQPVGLELGYSDWWYRSPADNWYNNTTLEQDHLMMGWWKEWNNFPDDIDGNSYGQLLINGYVIERAGLAVLDDQVAGSGNVLSNDFDYNGDPLTVANDGIIEGDYGTLTLNEDGTWSYLANDELGAGFTGADIFDIDVTDGVGTSSSTLTIEVAGLNDAPTLGTATREIDDTDAADTFAPVTGNLPGADVDTGDTLSYRIVGQTPDINGDTVLVGLYGTLTVHANGTYSYAPNAAAIDAYPEGFASDSFNVRVTDNHGSSATSTLNFHIEGVNDKPVITSSATVNAAENSTVV
ncbi:MAG: VCBS domain-containing protein, partial [Vicinamibacterales bacterium]